MTMMRLRAWKLLDQFHVGNPRDAYHFRLAWDAYRGSNFFNNILTAEGQADAIEAFRKYNE